ncbi:MAG: type IV toxin-antitoxin system AbiEi family antitoxin [Solirubrobacteraceae bacterium]
MAQLLDLSDGVRLRPQGCGVDLVIELPDGRRWVAEVKSSARSADVATAARQARAYAREGELPVVVVPYMGAAGARAAAAEGVGWVDLSGNARLRDGDLFVRVEGRPNRYPSRGRPSSPFAPASARVTRHLLQDPERSWRQAELSKATGLDDGRVSKLVARLDELELLERDGALLRPRDPDALLDAWAADYNFDGHDIVACHLTAPGGGVELAREIADGLVEAKIPHALTGLPAAWMLDKFAQFRLLSVFVGEDPRRVADLLGARAEPRGANVQLIGPNDRGVFVGAEDVDGVRVVAPVQAYLDLLALPERAREAAEHLREKRLNWRRHG